jgi:ubiquinone/menaquinone biosynthesis C-methylase UbiE
VFIQKIIPFIGKVATFGKGGVEYQYFQRSIVEFPTPKEFATQMTMNGLPVHNVTAFAYGSVQLYTASVSTSA